MTLRLGSTLLRAHPLALLFWIAAAALGNRQDVAALMIALAAHESAHLAAARCLGVSVSELRLMPFGGAISMENPYALPASRLLGVAAAGPAANLLTLVVGAALAHWQLLSPGFALALIGTNLTLALFNLLPALPLDGGRMLYALLAPGLGRSKAAEAGIWLGRGIAAMLVGLSVLSALRIGSLNLSPLFAAVFILASAGAERDALSGVRLKTMLSELKPLTEPVPARLCAVDIDCSIRRALRAARPDALTLYAVYDGSRLASFTDDRRLLRAMMERKGDGLLREAGLGSGEWRVKSGEYGVWSVER